MITRHKQALFFLIISLIAFIGLGVSNATAQEPTPSPDPRFGIAEAYLNSAEASSAGAGYTRIILRWDVIQPAGRDDWKPANVPDPFIEAELAAGREVVAVLIGTPAWASQGVNDSRAVPDMEAWGNFSKRIAQQYQGRIKHWIIWNEPDVTNPDNPGNTWLGTEQDYLELLKSAHSNIKNVDPTMQVHLAGLTYLGDSISGQEQYLSRLLRLISADPEAPRYGYYFDAVSYHLYYNPQQMLDILTQVRAILDSYGLSDKPVWVNETNAPPTDDPLDSPLAPAPFNVSSQEQAAFVIQAYALLIAGGADRIEFYKMRNNAQNPEDGVPLGLLRSDDSRRPAFKAYQVVSKYFAGYANFSWVHQGNTYIVTLQRGDSTTTVLWNTSSEDRPFSLNAIASQALLVDEAGNEQVIQAVGGAYTLVLPGATCGAEDCFIGGAPRLLVETGSPDQRASLIPLATSTPTVTPAPTDTPAPTATFTPTPMPTPTTVVSQTLNLQTSNPAVAVVAVSNATPTPNRKKSALIAPLEAETESETPKPFVAFSFASIFTPNRVIILIVAGVVLFTVIYFIQFRLWHRWSR